MKVCQAWERFVWVPFGNWVDAKANAQYEARKALRQAQKAGLAPPPKVKAPSVMWAYMCALKQRVCPFIDLEP